MITYTYIVKCPHCEDEFFDFFDEAKEFALSCLSSKPIITQTEVNRNDFGECTDHCDLGTVWSWEDVMKDTCTDAEPTKCIFTKDDLKAYVSDEDSEFANIDNSVDYEIDEISDELNEFVDSRGNKISITGGTVSTTPSQPAANTQGNTSSTLAQLASQLAMFDTNEILHIGTEDVTIPFSKEKMAYGNSFVYGDIFTNNTGSVIKEIHARTGINLRKEFGNNIKIWTYNDDDNTILVHIPGFNFIIDKNDLVSQIYNPNRASSRKPIPEGMTIEELVEAMEENEDNVECTKCGGLFEKAACTHNKEGFGWCCNTCEPADTLVEAPQEEYELATLVKDSINHLTNDLGKDPWADDFADDVIGDLECNYENYVPTDFDKYQEWCSAVASEVSRQVNRSEPASFLEELEEPEAYRERLGLCPECGADKAFDKDTGFCIECGFNI